MTPKEAAQCIRDNLANRSGFGSIQDLEESLLEEIDTTWACIIQQAINRNVADSGLRMDEWEYFKKSKRCICCGHLRVLHIQENEEDVWCSMPDCKCEVKIKND